MKQKTQISVDYELWQWVRKEAKEAKCLVAEVVERALQHFSYHAERYHTKTKKKWYKAIPVVGSHISSVGGYYQLFVVV